MYSVKHKASEAEALKNRRWGRCVDVGFGMDLKKIPEFTSCDDWWISLRAEVLKCETAYTYILPPSWTNALPVRFESFSPIDVR